MSSIAISSNYPWRDDYECRCDNCGSDWKGSELSPIEDAEQRLEPGAETPAGECPGCGALAFVKESEKKSLDL